MFGEISVSEVIRRNGSCPLNLERVPGSQVCDCHVFLGPNCAEYQGPCNYREQKLSALARYALGD